MVGEIMASLGGQAAGLGNMIAGAIAGRRARKANEKLGESPKFEIPASVDEYINRMSLMSRQEMPGYSQMKEDIQSSTATGLGQVGQLAQGEDKMAGLLGLMAGQRQSLRQLGTMAMQHQYGAQINAIQAGLQRAPWEEKEWEINEWTPWNVKKRDIMNMRNVSGQMISGGFDQYMGAGVQGANMYAQNEWANNMNPQYQPTMQYQQPLWQSPAINQLGMQQVAPARGLGYDPYYNGGVNPVFNQKKKWNQY